jgi:uncharacterized repeat protein (TIGR04052 family)
MDKALLVGTCVGVWGLLLAACPGDSGGSEGSGVDVEIPFQALVGDQPLSCQSAFLLGADGVAASFLDARLYVADVALIAGDEVLPVALQTTDFQRGSLALLDFEDDTGNCETGSPATHTSLRGRVASTDGVTGLSFVLGVPEADNHLDVTAAQTEPPLNIASMFWSWVAGYKFLKVDVATVATGRTTFFHVGSAACAGEPGSASCASPNRSRVTLEGPVLERGVVVHFGRLFADIALEQAPVEPDLVKGCMSGATDPECTGAFTTVLGLSHQGEEATEQALFDVAPDP